VFKPELFYFTRLVHVPKIYILSGFLFSSIFTNSTFKKGEHIIIYERWVYYQDFYFKFSQNTADMFKYNGIIHLCHEYQFDDKICSLQKQLQILHIFGEGLIFLIS
jgi:hypothetical protein